MAFTLTLFSLSGCDQSAQIERQDPNGVATAKTYFEFLRNGQYNAVEDTLDPSLKGDDFRAEFDTLVGTIPAESPLSVKPILAQRQCGKNICDNHIVLEYKYKDELLLFNVVLRQAGDQTATVGLHIRTIPKSVLSANQFRLAHKEFSHYAVLLLAISCPLFSLLVLFQCIRSNLGSRKWLWGPFIVFGVSKLEINWATGQVDTHLLAIQLLSASAQAPQYGPWMISFSLPLGAILFLITHKTGGARPASKNAKLQT